MSLHLSPTVAAQGAHVSPEKKSICGTFQLPIDYTKIITIN